MVLIVLCICFRISLNYIAMESFANATVNYEDTALSPYTQKILWFICIPVSIVTGSLITFFSISVAYFVRSKTYQRQKRVYGSDATKESPKTGKVAVSFTEISPENESGSTFTNRCPSIKEKSDHDGMILHYTLLLVVGVACLRIPVELLIIFVSGYSNSTCNILAKVMVVFTAIGIHGCHCFLWLRQYIILSNPILKRTRTKVLLYISYATYAVMLTTFTITMVLHIWWRDYINVNDLCQPEIASEKTSVYVPFGFLAASTVTIQISLTFLFVYPLLHHNRKMKAYKNGANAQIGMKNVNDKRQDRFWIVMSSRSVVLNKMVKRAIISSTVCVTTDAIGAISIVWSPTDLPICVLSVLYELNILLNLVCLFYTYSEWRKILFPCKYYKDGK